MARSLIEIQTEILAARTAAAELNALEVLTASEVTDLEASSISKVANWRLWVYIVAFVTWTLEKLQDIFKIEVEERIAASRIHTKDWYRDQALAYQHGHELDVTSYDNSSRTEKEVADAKIVKHAAVLRVIIHSRGVLRIKVAKEVGSELAQLSAEELTAFGVYMNRIADAGTTAVPTSGAHDDLKLELDVYYDPTIFNNEGKRLDGNGDTTVIDAINTYLSGIEFNGQLSLTRLTDKIQEVSGVNLPKIKSAWSKYGLHTYITEGVQNVGAIDELRVADAGYMRLDEVSTTINYIAYDE